jgi:hypothetical protein
MTEIEELDLAGTAVTDDALLHLARMGLLFDLSLANTAVTEAGIDRFGNLRNEDCAPGRLS